jgi:Pyruvate/2-oxoacid:ferredoxin oxidoreductase delta subunit
MRYLLIAVGLLPGGSTHLHTNNIWNNTNNNRTTQITTNVEECGPCPVFASFAPEFAFQLRKKHGKASVRVRKTSVRLRKTSVTVQYTHCQKHSHITKPTHTHTHTHSHTH